MTDNKNEKNSRSFAKNDLQYSSNEKTKSQDFMATILKYNIVEFKNKDNQTRFLFINGSKRDRD